MPPEASPRTAQNERERLPSIHTRPWLGSAPLTRKLRPALRWTQGSPSLAPAVRGSTSDHAPNMSVSTFRGLLCLQNTNSRVAPSKSPSQFSVGAALDLRGIYALECVVKLNVAVLYQILPHDT